MIAWLILIPTLLLLPTAGAQRVPAEAPQTRTSSANLAILFEHARRHETEAVLRLKPGAEQGGDRVWEIGYYVALYIASPEKYRNEFVEHFPVDSEGIMRILYEQIELPKLTPKWLFSFAALGEIARAGDAPAMQRCLNGMIHSEGAVAESYCDSIEKAFGSQPETWVKVLQSGPEDPRGAIATCFSAWKPDTLERLEKSLSSRKAEPDASPQQRARIEQLLGWVGAAEKSRRTQASSESGIEGIVLIGPTRPVVRVGDDTPDEVPIATQLQVVRAPDGGEVARLESGQDGKFRIALPPGEYVVRQAQEPGRRYPIAAEVPVQVHSGKYSSITLHLDSGLR